MKGKLVDGQFIEFNDKYIDYDGKRYIYPLNNPNAPFLQLGWKEVIDKDEEVEYNVETQHLEPTYEETETEIIRSYVAVDNPIPEPVIPVEPSEEELLRIELEELLQWFEEYDIQVAQYNRSQRLGVPFISHLGTIQEMDALAEQKANRINEIRELLKENQ